ncbi:MAG: DUF2309 domain-containing protein [Nitrospira sp.]
MAALNETIGRESRRMELRGVVRLAGEIIAHYWPMRTFVHHNPLHALEYLPFVETLRRGKQFLGGDGYLPSHVYRAYVASGRIRPAHLDTALEPLARGQQIVLGSRKVTHVEVLRACLTEGLCSPAREPLDDQLSDPDRELIDRLESKLEWVLEPPSLDEQIEKVVAGNRYALCRWLTLSHWCDDTLGTRIVRNINDQMIKWCSVFLDEGHAAWPMPDHQEDFYHAWKRLAGQEWSVLGIADSRKKLAALPDHPEDALLESLDVLGIPTDLLQDYLSLQLTALPGWAGFIKWRSEARDYPWQLSNPVSLVKFLAIRLWYARELVQAACDDHLGIRGRFEDITTYMHDHAEEYYLRRQRIAGHLPALYAEEVDRLARRKGQSWKSVLTHYRTDVVPRQQAAVRRGAARRLLALAQSLGITNRQLIEGPADDFKEAIEWIEAFPESAHGPVWLAALEAGYHEQLVAHVMEASRGSIANPDTSFPMRPYSQSVYCIDVRSEPYRRHLESIGPHETFGFAGFFAAFIRYRAWGKEHDTEQFPVIMRHKNEVREIPRSYFDHKVSQQQTMARWAHAGHTLLHDLKENVITPYVMVESVGWFYGIPILGKTLFPSLYRRFTTWLRRQFMPSLPTTLTVDKLSPNETGEMLKVEHQRLVRLALQERLGLRNAQITPSLIEGLRQRSLEEDSPQDERFVAEAKGVGLTEDAIDAFVVVLRREYDVNPRAASRHKERVTRTGFTLDEQVLTVETALRMMGLTKNFARLVLFCAHGSTSDNNPYESALDCGACGGNNGAPNARVLAMMANNHKVRDRLRKTGMEIPSDTHFLAGQMDTTTDAVQLFDLEDVPPTHRADLARLQEDLNEAGELASRERCGRFPELAESLTETQAATHVRQRSADWSQVRPEWGLSTNTTFLIGRRDLTKGLNLNGRVFLHSYDYREDPTTRYLEVVLTGPQVVAQWINMEHYFSTVDNEVYGSGSKIYHNVVGRLGVMSGPWSDLRLGLARQTVIGGDRPYHEPMRLLTIVEAPRKGIEKLIARHDVLQRYYHNEWVHLIVFDPGDREWYRYRPSGEWTSIMQRVPALAHGSHG